MNRGKKKGQKFVAWLLALTMVLSTIFSFGATAFADEKDNTSLTEFEKAMEFFMYLNGDKPKEGQESQLEDKGESGVDQTLWLRWVYSDGSIPVNAKDTYMELTFPKGITPAYPGTSTVADFKKSDGPDGSTILRVSWEALTGGHSKETFVTFKMPNGTTPDGKTYDIPIKVFYKDQESKTHSQTAKFTTVAKNFKWNGSHSASTNSGSAKDENRTLPNYTCNYSLSSSYNDVQHKGVVYAEKLAFSETVTVDPNIDIKEENLVAGDGITFSGFEYRDGSYLSSFVVNYKATSSDTATEINTTLKGATFTIKEAKINDSVEENTTITSAFYANGGKGVATAVAAADGKDPGESEFTFTNNWKASASYSVTPAENHEASQKVGIGHSYYRGHTGGTYTSDKGVYTNDQVGTYLHSFGNKQSKEITDYKIVQLVDSDLMFPIKLKSGKNNGPATTYTINLYDKSGAKIGSIKDVSYTVNKEYILEEALDSGKIVTDIAKIEWDYGTVPAGFKPSTDDGANTDKPFVVYNIKAQTPDANNKFIDPEVKAGVQYTYESKTYPADPGKMYLTSYIYSYKMPKDTDTLPSRNKEVVNLTNPGAIKPAAGDLLEYTITVTNRSGMTLVSPEIEDRSVNQKLYTEKQVDGYPAGHNAMVIKCPDDSGLEVTDAYIKNAGAADEHNFIKLKGTIKPEEQMQIKYVMKVNDDVAKDAKVTNKFDAFGYPIGGGNVRVWMDDGYREDISSGGHAEPRLDITYDQKNADGSYHKDKDSKIAKGETVDITYTVTNNDYLKNGKSGSVNLGNYLQRIKKNGRADAFEYVTNTGKVQLPNGAVKSVNATGDTNLTGDYTVFRFDFTGSDISGSDGTIKIEPGQKVTLTYKLRVTREGVSGSNLYEDFENYFFSCFTQNYSEMSYSTAINGGTPGKYVFFTSDGSDIDKTSTTKSYTSDNTALFVNRAMEKYAAIYNTLNTNVNLDGNTTRTYTSNFYNYSEKDLKIELDKFVARLPQYESYVDGSAKLQYNDGSLSGAIPLEKAVHIKTVDNRRIMQFSDASGKLPNNPQHGMPAIAGNPNGSYYATLTLSTEIKGADLESLVAKMTGTSFADASGFSTAYYLKGAETVKAGGSGVRYWYPTDDETIDWDNSTATELFYKGNEVTPTNVLSNVTVPGISIKSYKVLKEDDAKEGFYDVGDGVVPGYDAGFEVVAGNNTSSKEIKNPKIVVVMPLGTTFNGFLNDEKPDEITDISIASVDKRQVVTFSTDLSLKTAGNFFKFNIKADTTEALGLHQADAYLVPMNLFEKFINVYSGFGSKVKKNYNEITGSTDAATNKDFDMVYNKCTVPIYGMFAFASNIEVQQGASNKASSGETVTVARDAENKLKYTLNFTNESKDRTYENYVLINRLPGKNDIYNVNPDKRKSTADVVMTSDPVITYNGKTLAAGTDYELLYSKDARNTVYNNNKEYIPTEDTAANWDGTIDKADATAFRILFKTKIAPKGEIKLTYDAEFAESLTSLPRIGVAANNSFAFGLNPVNSSQLYYAEPVEVGVNLENNYISQVDGKIFVDVNGDGVFTSGTDKLYTDPIDVTLNSVDGLNKTKIGTVKTSTSGAYQFEDLKDNTKYEVSYEVPTDHKQSEKYKAAGTSSTPIENNFKMVDGKATAEFTTPQGEDSHYYANGALDKTAGVMDGKIFIDKDEDGKYDAAKGDSLFPSKIKVNLVNESDTVIQTVDTDVATGNYKFASAALGKYKVKFNAPANYKRTTASTDFTGTTSLATGLKDLTATNDHITANAGLITQEAPKDPTKIVSSAKGKDGAAVKIGDEITYTISYFNHNPDPANVTITDVLDKGVEFVSADNGGTENNGTVTWNLTDAPAEKPGTVTVTVKVLETADAKVYNQASVKVGSNTPVNTGKTENQVQVDVNYQWASTDNPTDVNPPTAEVSDKGSAYNAKNQEASADDNYVFRGWYTDEDCLAAHAFADGTKLDDNTTLYGRWESSSASQDPEKIVTSDKGKNGTAVRIGDEITYTISYYNHKPSPATVTITDELDKGVEFVSAGNGGSFKDGTVTWTLSNVKEHTGGSVTVTVKVLKSAADGKISNQASVKVGNDQFVDSNEVKNPVSVAVKYAWVGSINPKDVKPPLNGEEDVITKSSEYTARTQDPTDERIEKRELIFNGWYTDKELKNEFVDGTKVDEDITLYGMWEEGDEADKPIKEGYPIYIDYEWVGKDQPTDVKPPARDNSESGKAYTALTQKMTKDKNFKWTFDGWYRDSECKTKYRDETVLDRDVTLYGRWIKETIQVEENTTKNDPTGSSTKPNGNGTKTGDESNMALYVGLAALAALGAAGATVPAIRRRRSK